MDKQKQTMIEFYVNFISLDQRTGSPIVVLKEKEGELNRILLIWIGDSEAAAIQRQLENAVLPRPLTHDLLKVVIETLDAKVTATCVHAVQEETFYARITLEANGNAIELDCRPSDAIALALRCEAPIYVAEEVVVDHGFSEKQLERAQKHDPKDVLQNLDDDTLKQYTV